ncbi:hypothetical protein [Robinsoniella peoriensis]
MNFQTRSRACFKLALVIIRGLVKIPAGFK